MSASYPDLAGRVALITGGGSGIGAHIVAALAAQGCRVAFLDIDVAASQATVARIGGAEPPLFIPCDLTDVAALEAAVRAIEARLGPIRILVNNAANDRRQPIGDTTADDWDGLMDVNLRHQFFAAKAAHAGMKAAGGGAIVNLSSIAWMFGAPDMVAYATAKSAVIGLTRSLAAAFGPDRIRVNALAPGAVMTPKQLKLWHTPESTARIVSMQALKEQVLEDDIANAVVFLASDAARMITKQCLTVDGGLR
jgi:NAD(P)-dependent dehydrogenase (short-subunit alcohol dehydrogenase family)